MHDNITASPLSWPAGWKRTPSIRRTYGQFGTKAQSQHGSWTVKNKITVAQATQRLMDELERMAVRRQDVILSTDLALRNDGLPRSGQRKPDDPGAAVYLNDPFNGQPRCMAIDRYTDLEQNIAALAATIEAMRAIERHGGAVVLERAFTGFAALPPPGGTASTRTWREVLGFGADWHGNAEAVEAQYRRLASQRHPDKGGSTQAMAELNLARQQALEAI